MRTKERRSEEAGISSDRVTIQIIVWTVCSISIIFAATMCRLALSGLEIPEQIDRAIVFVIGTLSGWIGKTGAEKYMGNKQLAQDIGESVSEESQKRPIKTDQVETDAPQSQEEVERRSLGESHFGSGGGSA